MGVWACDGKKRVCRGGNRFLDMDRVKELE